MSDATIHAAEPLMTVRQLARLLQVHPQTIYSWKDRADDPLPCLRFGSAVRFERSSALAWAETRREASYA